jgi:hypothetical protein
MLMPSWKTVVVVPLLVACGGNQFPGRAGVETELLFPFDGERYWQYKASDDNVPYLLEGELLQEVGKYDGRNVYTINFVKDCFQNDPNCFDDDLVFSLSMSNFSPLGVFINGYDDGFGPVTLDPPVHVAEREALLNDPIETQTAGRVFQSNYTGIEGCDPHVVASVQWDCYGFDVSADTSLFPVTMQMYAVPAQGIVAMQFADEDYEWQLASSGCEGDCDGVW